MNSDPDEYSAARQQMLENQIVGRGIRDAAVIRAMGVVPRDRFVPQSIREFAYEDTPLPIGFEQTISQPYIVAYMTEALELSGGERVLEIGTGSGYAAAVLAEIAGQVFGVERFPRLAANAQKQLRDLGYDNVMIGCHDGTLGWQQYAPFDAIVVAAGGPSVPESLKSQLKTGGRLVMPIGSSRKSQNLVRVRRVGQDDFCTESIGQVRFVPLVGDQGWAGENADLATG